MEQGYVFSKPNGVGGINVQKIMMLPWSGKYAIYASWWEDRVYNSMVFDTYEDAVAFLKKEGFNYC